MLSNIIRGEYVTEVRYELAFDDGHGNGYGFPCDENGAVNKGLTPDALRNLEYCRQHPEAFERANEVVEIRLEYKEEDRGTCRCGETVYLHDQYRAACQCPKCGQRYNLFGQELKDDPRMIVSAAGRAEKAVKLILNVEPTEQNDEGHAAEEAA